MLYLAGRPTLSTGYEIPSYHVQVREICIFLLGLASTVAPEVSRAVEVIERIRGVQS
jgi:hypothetical protein